MRFRTRLFINLNHLSNNLDKIKKIAPNNEILFMVKADAYGHGMVSIVKYAHEELKMKCFGVATLGEAKKLREELPRSQFEIYVFSDTQLKNPMCKEIYLSERIIPVISNFSDLQFFLEDSDFQFFPLIMKFNTGMNRLGLKMGELEEIIKLLKKNGRRSIYHLLSHFSSAAFSVKDDEHSKNQYNNFLHLKKEFKSSGIDLERTSMANSGAIEQGFALNETHIRPGLMLYGPTGLNAPHRHLSSWDGLVLSRLETYIIDVFEVKAKETIGYGAKEIPYDGVLVIVALGYGDGISTSYEGTELEHKGHIGKIFGNVNMDMAQILFKPEAKADLKIREKFEIWNHSPKSILNFSDQTKRIPYEIFCQLTGRVPRVYGLE